jgi:hypothetical protein
MLHRKSQAELNKAVSPVKICEILVDTWMMVVVSRFLVGSRLLLPPFPDAKKL